MKKDQPKDLSMIATEQTLTGTNLLNWLKLLWNNKFRISLKYLHKFLLINVMIWFSTPFIIYEKIRFNRKIKRTKIEQDPIFLIGHWRSGTTYLHMLLTSDKNNGFASNLQCFMPHIFLGSKKLYSKIVGSAMPEYRRQDNFKLGVNFPSEEDFAVSNMCQYSFYHGLSFPRRRQFYGRYITFNDVPEKEINHWKKIYYFLLQKLTYANNGKRLVLKNPPNTGRIKFLLEMFPNAKFVHIYRNPYDVYPSTVKLYLNLVPPFFLQKPEVTTPENIILDIYEEMHKKYFTERELIPKGNLIEIRYEDFLADPLSTMEKIYKELSLPNFAEAELNFKEYIDEQQTYKTNTHNLSKEMMAKISSRWKQSFEVWDYPIEE
ncbi:MAG: sulfotransferase [Candidatus Thorarchaeota archaeon]